MLSAILTAGSMGFPVSADEYIPESTRFITKYGVELTNDSPEYDDTEDDLTEAQTAQRAYIRGYVQELEDLIMEPGGIDAARHKEIAERMIYVYIKPEDGKTVTAVLDDKTGNAA